MSDSFDCYHVWLGIPASEQPPHHYRLLGISIFESDPDVIDHAADRQMAHVRTFQSGRHAAKSQQVLNALEAARLCLLVPDKKAAYDEQLRGKTAKPAKAVAVPVAKAVPVAPAASRSGRPIPQAKPVAKPKLAPAAVHDPFDLATELAAPTETFEVGESISAARGRRRKFGRKSNWQSAAVLGTLSGVVVVVLFAMYTVLSKQSMSWSDLWHKMTSPQAVEANPAPGPTGGNPQQPPPPNSSPQAK